MERNWKKPLWILLAIYTVNCLDRQVINIIMEPVRNELGLHDWQIGMISGFGFAILYTLGGVLISQTIERGDRVKALSAALVVWSGFTVVCGFALNAWHLLLARMGVGLGEAGCAPAAHSLIGDYVPQDRRASAFSLYSLGMPIGSMLALGLGGFLIQLVGWRGVLMIAGVPGLLLAAICWMALPEPRRGRPDEVRTAVSSRIGGGFWSTMLELKHVRSFWGLAVGSGFYSLVVYSQQAFYTSFYIRNHAVGLNDFAMGLSAVAGVKIMPISAIGMALAISVGVFASCGTFLGGWLVDHVGKSTPRSFIVVLIVSAIAMFPFSVLPLLATNVYVSLALLTFPMIFMGVWIGPALSAIQFVIPPYTRATGAAILLFVMNIIGLGLGPLTIGIMSDAIGSQLGSAGAGLRYAMILGSASSLVALFFFALASRFYGSECAAQEAAIREASGSL